LRFETTQDDIVKDVLTAKNARNAGKSLNLEFLILNSLCVSCVLCGQAVLT
jgi:hypothetical protein